MAEDRVGARVLDAVTIAVAVVGLPSTGVVAVKTELRLLWGVREERPTPCWFMLVVSLGWSLVSICGSPKGVWVGLAGFTVWVSVTEVFLSSG